jgi:hypothetical protein
VNTFTYHGGGVLSKARADGRRVYFVKYRRDVSRCGVASV